MPPLKEHISQLDTLMQLQQIKYVYAVKSAAFPGLIKIGRTQNMRERLSQLNVSCAPAPFVVVAVSPTLDYVRDEKMAHEFFSSQRRKGEFFSASESAVKDIFKTIQENFEVESSQPLVVDSAADTTRKAQDQVCRLLLFSTIQHLERVRNVSRVSHAELDSVQHQEPVELALDENLNASAPEEDAATVGFKRRREELELSMLEEEIRAMARTRLVNLKNDLEELADPAATKLDDSTRLIFKDCYINLIMTPPLSVRTAGPANQRGHNKP